MITDFDQVRRIGNLIGCSNEILSQSAREAEAFMKSLIGENAYCEAARYHDPLISLCEAELVLYFALPELNKVYIDEAKDKHMKKRYCISCRYLTPDELDKKRMELIHDVELFLHDGGYNIDIHHFNHCQEVKHN